MTRKNRNVQAVIPKGNEKGTKGAQKEPRVASKRIDVSVLTYKILGANIITCFKEGIESSVTVQLAVEEGNLRGRD